MVVIDSAVFDSLYHALRWTWHDPDGYNIVSGPIADVTLLGGAYAILRRHNCHVKRCWRIGRFPVHGTSYIVCRRHHPHQTPTAAHVLAAHDAAAHGRPIPEPPPNPHNLPDVGSRRRAGAST